MGKLVFGVAVVACVVLAPERPARACGGCFSPPDTPTVVTDHRMLLSVSLDQTTLYDQIQYSGSPDSFAWVLPIAGTADVGLSSDLLFDVLDTLTQTTVYPPPRNCPAPPPNCVNSFGGAAADASATPGVQVLKQEVVGPYETVQLASSDPQALDDWLGSHGYQIPSDVQPIIDAYVSEGFDFLALKLVPGESVQSMRPVRVTTQGASPVLPLRMVAAGTGSTVGITLWVVSDGRYEPSNFPFFHIEDSEIVWNWDTSSSNFAQVRQAKEQAANDGAWEIESSLWEAPDQIVNLVDNGGYAYNYNDYDAGQDYEPIGNPDGGDGGETADQVRADDLATLFQGMSPTQVRVTRMRADLSRAALGVDLRLQASADQSTLSNQRYPTASTGTPACPSYDYCNGGLDEAAVRGGCGVSPRGEGQGQGTLFAIFGALALAAHGMIRRKRR